MAQTKFEINYTYFWEIQYLHCRNWLKINLKCKQFIGKFDLCMLDIPLKKSNFKLNKFNLHLYTGVGCTQQPFHARELLLLAFHWIHFKITSQDYLLILPTKNSASWCLVCRFGFGGLAACCFWQRRLCGGRGGANVILRCASTSLRGGECNSGDSGWATAAPWPCKHGRKALSNAACGFSADDSQAFRRTLCLGQSHTQHSIFVRNCVNAMFFHPVYFTLSMLCTIH